VDFYPKGFAEGSRVYEHEFFVFIETYFFGKAEEVRVYEHEFFQFV